MDKYVTLKKSDFNEFIANLVKQHKVVAPVDKGCGASSFAAITSGDEIVKKYIPTILPPKKYFLPQKENLVKYDKDKAQWTPVMEYESLVLFGVRTCDLAGIQCLNLVFEDKPKDINYIIRKNKIAILGFECNDYCDEHASCAFMGNHLPKGGYDLFFTELKDVFIIHQNTLVGEKLISEINLFSPAMDKNMDELNDLREKKRKTFKPEVKVDQRKLKDIMDKTVGGEVWDDLEEKCVSCGNCTNVCPTCYCFDIEENINLDLNTGVRTRVWDSCQNEDFAKVAGNENFREERGARQRHRYMRKFSYPVGKYKRFFCTGCGRCSRACMAKINLKETIQALSKETKWLKLI